MKIAFTVLAVFVAVAAQAASIGKVIVRQQWPWSTDIKVEYLLSGVTEPVDVSVACFDGETPLASDVMHNAISGDLRSQTLDGVKTITIDPVKAFGAGKAKIENFRVELTVGPADPDNDEVIYRIYDLSDGSFEDVTRGDLLSGKYGDYETNYGRIGNGFNTTLKDVLIWTGVTNNPAYKTTHMVMRKIPAKGVVWTMGSPEGEVGRGYSYMGKREDQHKVKLMQDYFIGVFPMTQAQLKNSGFSQYSTSNPSKFCDAPDSDFRPAENISYAYYMRGWESLKGVKTGENVNWPTNSYRHDVFSGRATYQFRTCMKGVPFDFPTDAQWEFACRAGTTNALYSGKEVGVASSSTPSAALEELAWTKFSDYSSEPGGEAQTMPVGLKKPNAFGLYDLYGNVSEWCLDWFSYDLTGGDPEAVQEEPNGPDVTGGANKDDRVIRGSDYTGCAFYQRSAYRNAGRANSYTDFSKSTTRVNIIGIRWACPVASDWMD